MRVPCQYYRRSYSYSTQSTEAVKMRVQRSGSQQANLSSVSIVLFFKKQLKAGLSPFSHGSGRVSFSKAVSSAQCSIGRVSACIPVSQQLRRGEVDTTPMLPPRDNGPVPTFLRSSLTWPC